MSDLLEAKRVLDIEAQSILFVKESLNEDFQKAIDIICQCQGKVIIAGMGKSGHIGRKIASTMSSTGTPAIFLHPAESSHGDMGMISASDCLVVISYGGGSQELNDLLTYVNRKGIPMIAMTSNFESPLAKHSSAALSIAIKEEACPLGLAPTSSSTVTLALGDALAMAVLKRKGFREEDFAEFHPGGRLGRRLLTRVEDLMHDNGHLPIVVLGAKMKDVIGVMADSDVRGVAGVVNEAKELVGVITDGDLRRHLEKNKNPLEAKVDDLMSKKPKTIHSGELAVKAMFLMEQFTIQSLFVVNAESNAKKPIGLLHLQDLIRAKIQ